MAVKLINRIFNSLAELFIKDGNLRVEGNALSKVNGVSDVYLGCPIGTIVMWAGDTAPDGWLLCDGKTIFPGDGPGPSADYKGSIFEPLYLVIKNTYGGSMPVNLPDLRQRFPIGYNNISRYVQIKRVYDSYSGWNFSLSQLVDPDNGNFRKIQGSGPQAVAMRNDEGKLIGMVSDFYNISLTSTNLDDKVDEINSKAIFGLGSTGGELMHTLTAGESGLPSHSHSLLVDTNSSTGHAKPLLPDGSTAGTTAHPLNQTSNSESDYTKDTDNEFDTRLMYDNDPINALEAHNNVPPYLAINFIIKYQ